MGDTNKDDVDFIRALAAVLRENDLTELEVSRQTGEDQQKRTQELARQAFTQQNDAEYHGKNRHLVIHQT